MPFVGFYFFLFLFIYLFLIEMGIGVTCFGLLSGECLAQLGEPWQRKAQQHEPALGEHST